MTDSDDQWTDKDSARATFEALPADHPCRTATKFNDLIMDEADAATLAELVTPECLEDWGDFRVARSFFLDQAISISTRSLRHRGASDVAYVKLVPDDGKYISATARQDAIAWATLVWRPEYGGWRIHSIGQPAPPHLLPRTAPQGSAPVSGVDQEVRLDEA